MLPESEEFLKAIYAVERFEKMARDAAKSAGTLAEKLPHHRLQHRLAKIHQEMRGCMIDYAKAVGVYEQAVADGKRCEECGEMTK